MNTAMALSLTDETKELGEVITQIDQNPTEVFLGSHRGLTRSTYLSSLGKIARLIGFDDCYSVPWWKLRHGNIAKIQSDLSEIQKYSTTNRDCAALKGVLACCWNLDLISGNDYLKAVNIKSLRGSTVPAGRDLSSGEIAALIAACLDDKPTIGARNVAILATMCAPMGIRRSEVAGLNKSDYDPETGKILILGKGGKERIVIAEQGGRDALDSWIEIRGELETDALFVPIKQDTTIQDRRMSIQAVHNLLQRLGKQARLSESFTPHDLRRTCVGDMLDAGIDLAIVQRVLGHASPLTTARYDRRPMRAVRAASSKVHFPYVKRSDAQGKLAI